MGDQKLKTLWFWVALAGAAAAGFAGYQNLPHLLNWLMPGNLPTDYLTVLKSDTLVVVSGRTATALVAFSLLGLVVPAIGEAVMLANATSKIKLFPPEGGIKPRSLSADFLVEMSDLPVFGNMLSAYGRFLVEEDKEGAGGKGRKGHATPQIKALTAAETFLGPNILVDQRLRGWLFKPLASLLLGLGLTVFIWASLIGFHDYRQALATDPVASGGMLWIWVEEGLFSLGFCALGALIIALLSRITFGLREAQAAAFCRFLDAKFGYTPQSALLGEVAASAADESQKLQASLEQLSAATVKAIDAARTELADTFVKASKALEHRLNHGIEMSLRAPLDRMTEATRALTSEQGILLQDTIKAVLEAFIRELNAEIGTELKATNTILQSTASLSAKVEKNFNDAIRTLGRQSKLQTESVTGVTQEIDKALAGVKSFEAALESATATIEPALNQISEHHATLLAALNDEKSAGRTINQAAAEMTKAAKASRKTVQSFIALAENLKEVSRSLNLAGSGAPANSLTIKASKPEQKLSQAIRDLIDKAGTTQKLPKL